MASMAIITTFLLLMAARSHCSAQSSLQTDEVTYWKTALPKTPIPSVIQGLLTSVTKEVQKTFSLKNRLASSDINIYQCQPHKLVIPTDPKTAGFLLRKDLRTGTTMTMRLGSTTDKTGFLTREAAGSIRFSSSDAPQILTRFNVRPSSPEADVIKKTLQLCETPKVDGEIRRCFTTLESMVEFVTSILGTADLKAMATTCVDVPVPKRGAAAQSYTIIAPGPRLMAGSSTRSMTCHPLTFPFAVYNCHSIDRTEVYEVPMVREDGARVSAVVNCHMDTESWDPDNESLEVLRVKPGVPICHFTPEDNLVWAPQK